MRVLVTGGAGFIGSHIADAFVERGDEVSVFDNLSTGRRENVPRDATFFEGNLQDRARVSEVVETTKPNWVVHQGAQTSVSVSTREPIADAESNVVGSLTMLQAAVENGVEHFVFASTGGAIYGEVAEPERAEESRTPRPLSPYACSKLAVEHYLEAFHHEHGLSYSVLRYANVFGPRQDPHGEAGVVAIFARRLLEGEALQINAREDAGDDGCIRDYVYVADVVAANLAAVSGSLGARVTNVGTGLGTSTRSLADKLAAELGVTPTLRFAGRRPGDLMRSVLAPHDGMASTALEDGLRATAEWFRAS